MLRFPFKEASQKVREEAEARLYKTKIDISKESALEIMLPQGIFSYYCAVC